MEYAMNKWTQLSMLLAKFQNTWWSSAEASAKEEFYIGSDYQGILNQQVDNKKPQHIPKLWLLYYFRENTNA